MKIEGTVNIMGMHDVIFRQKYRGKFYEIVQYQKLLEGTWIRICGGETDGFQRSHESIISSIKSLSFNPTVSLTFNDGAMYVDFLKENLSNKEWNRLEQYVDMQKEEFTRVLKEMIS